MAAIPGIGWLGAGLLQGTTEAALTAIDGGSLEDVLKAFTVGFVTGVVIHGAGKALSKIKFCFIVGTAVVMATGAPKAIENIRPGDMVKSYNQVTGKTENKRVLQNFNNKTKELVTVSTSDNQQIIATPGHKFYANNAWISAVDLRAGDILVNVNGQKVIVEQIQHEILDTSVKVYNFEVADNHTYFVGGESGIAVHNAACSGGKVSSKKVGNTTSVKKPFDNIQYTTKVNEDILRDIKHGFPNMIDDIAAKSGRVGDIVGNDGVKRIIVELPGAINGSTGVYQWIIDLNGMCNHRFFQTDISKIFLN